MATLTVSPKSVALGEPVTIVYNYDHPLKPTQSLWARTDCQISDGSIGFTDYTRLDDQEADSVTVGATPSWDGTGGASCTVQLVLIDNGKFRNLNADDDFTVTP